MKTNPAPAPDTTELTANSIRLRAYYRWLDRGCPEGNDWHDWFAAEAELRQAPEEVENEETAPAGAASAHFSIKETLAAHLSDPLHRFHSPGTAHDNRTNVLESGARQRVRARQFGGSRQAQRREGS